MKTIGYAIVGTGYFGAELGRIINKEKGAKVIAILDPKNGETISKELKCDLETDLDALYSRKDINAVIVATPNYLHKEPVIKAAEHKINVFCEKPIALSYKDCDEMVSACHKNKVIFMAGHVMNFFKGVRYAKKVINEGVIGDILYCHSARNGWEEMQSEISWKKIKEKSGGHLYHHIHELDCVQFIMGGMPETVTMTAEMWLIKAKDLETKTICFLLIWNLKIIGLLFANGVLHFVGLNIMCLFKEQKELLN